MLILNNQIRSIPRIYAGLKVLIITSAMNDHEFIVDRLMRYGITALIVGSTAEAMHELQNQNFALVLLRVDAYQFNEYEIAFAKRCRLKNNLPIIGFSNLHIENIKYKCFEAGMNAVFSKPEDLAPVVREFLPHILKSLPAGSQGKSRYAVIDLTYLKEISMDDVKFEKEITEKFLSLIDQHLLALRLHLQAGEIAQLRTSAHCTLSTIYIMGLNDWLEQPLKRIEYDDLPFQELETQVNYVAEIMEKAKTDASRFLQTLN